MESTTSKAEVLKPVILKAGVPLAVSLAGFIYAWILTKKSLSKASSASEVDASSSQTNSQDKFKREESFHSLASMADEEKEEEHGPKDSAVLARSSETHDDLTFGHEIAGLTSRIEGLQMRELALRLQFDKYCDLKEQESLFMEISNVLSQETTRVEFLDREISSMEAENKRLENFIFQYLKIIEQLEYRKSENGFLQRKVQKLLRKSKAQSRLIKEQTLKIQAREAEILRNHDALQTRVNAINKLEDEIRDLQKVLDQLQDEKNELLKKLDTAEKSNASSKIETGQCSKEDYNQLLNELEQLKKERAAEVKELIFLRWTNACLRHELMRHHEHQQQQQQNQEKDHIELEFDGTGGFMHYESSEHELEDPILEHHNVPCLGGGGGHSDRTCSKRKKLLNRLKRWVEGSEKARVKPEDKDRQENKCLGRHSVSSEAEEPHVPARRSCSSA